MVFFFQCSISSVSPRSPKKKSRKMCFPRSSRRVQTHRLLMHHSEHIVYRGMPIPITWSASLANCKWRRQFCFDSLSFHAFVPISSICIEMGKCLFDETWLQNPKYANWIARDHDDRKYRCRHCRKSLIIGSLGYRALDSHMGSERHKLRTGSQNRNTVLDQFVRAAEESTTAQPADTPRTSTTASKPSQCTVSVSGNDTLRAE